MAEPFEQYMDVDNLEVAGTELAHDPIWDLNPERQHELWDGSTDTWLTKQQVAEAKTIELDRFQEMGGGVLGCGPQGGDN